MQIISIRHLAIAALFSIGSPVQAADEPVWPDNFLTRVETLALMQSLNAELLASRSATLTLEKWCRDHHLADPAKIVAILKREGGGDKPPSAEQRKRLQVEPGEPVKYRRVQLLCGERLLSEADNWYVPGRLTAEMNRLLETTNTPFGKAVLALEPTRQTFAASLLWSPLPGGWESAAVSQAPQAAPLTIPDALFEHRAVLYTRDKVPFSEVDEVYQRQILAFPPPPQ
ncbi:hypothetical protein [Telmatospirillum siberiense]|uniref:Uncharacterized protein n=1 Tax=Telmatospirillum siberiense TaxID=382514 RepID=A0A2N3PZ30_9PROT|nr:hypothetical protein [Telmatospirillum siberiense]PKU25667.1 hypothetical protein CWS72_06320 [Telmatospirillum siberiense]